MKILLDPGHGDPWGGAVGHILKIREQDVALSVCRELKHCLEDLGHACHMTRYDGKCLIRKDRTLDLNARAVMAGAIGADCLVSIHCNSAVATTAKGYECFTTPGQDESDRLAAEMIKYYGKAFPQIKLRADRRDGDDDKEANLRVIKQVAPGIAAVLFELAFISNPVEEAFLANKINHQLIACALARGIDNWGRLKQKG